MKYSPDTAVGYRLHTPGMFFRCYDVLPVEHERAACHTADVPVGVDSAGGGGRKLEHTSR